MSIKITIPLPFLGIINDNTCKGIKLNHRLFTQCTKNVCDNSTNYCEVCYNQCRLNPDNKPQYGNINERLIKYRNNENYTYNGIVEDKYGNILNKLKITKEKAIKELQKLNIVYDNDIFNTDIKKRGRPKKITSTPNDDNTTIIKKNRGRPRKNNNNITIDDLYDETIHISVKQELFNNQLIYIDSNGNKYDTDFNLLEI
jgi:hypothetical protein